mgnify:CR=1 FL=1
MSTIKANDLTNTTGGIPTVKGQRLIPTAWVNFNGTGTVAIRDSENVSSVTDNSTGEYQINFAVAMANTNYSVVGMADEGSTNGYVSMYIDRTLTITTSSCLVQCINNASSYKDATYAMIQVMGGQA